MQHIIKYNNALYLRVRKAQRGIGRVNIAFCIFFSIAAPITVVYVNIYIIPLIFWLASQFFIKDIRLGPHSIDIQHLIPMLQRGRLRAANIPFIIDLFDIGTAALLPVILVIIIAQPKLIITVICLIIINSLTMSYIMFWTKRKRWYKVFSIFYTAIGQGILLFALHLSEYYAKIDFFVLQHWIAFSLLSVLCTAGTYYAIIQRVMRAIIDCPFRSPEIMVKNMYQKK